MKVLKYILGFLLFGGMVYSVWRWGPALWRWFFGRTKELAENLRNMGPGLPSDGGQRGGPGYNYDDGEDDFSLKRRNGRKPPIINKYYKRKVSTIMNSIANMKGESFKQFQKRSGHFQHNGGKNGGYRVDEVSDEGTGYEVIPYINPKIMESYNTPEKKLRLGRLTPQQMEACLRRFHKSICKLVQKYGSRVSVEYLENLDRWWDHFRNLKLKKDESFARLEEDTRIVGQLDQKILDFEKKAASAQEEAAKAKKKVNKLTEKLADKKKQYKELIEAKKELEERLVKEHKKATQDLKLKYKEKVKKARAEIERLRDGLQKDTVLSKSLVLRQNGTSRFNQDDNRQKHQWLEEYTEAPSRYKYNSIKFDN